MPGVLFTHKKAPPIAEGAWKQVDEKWYYFNENSLMVTDQTTPDGYYVNADGVWIQ